MDRSENFLKKDRKFYLSLSLLIADTLGLIALVIFIILSYTALCDKVPDSIVGVCFTLVGSMLTVEKILFEKCRDSQPWERMFRATLKSSGKDKNSPVRISYSAALRIEVNGYYLLVKNSHGLKTYTLPARTYSLDALKKDQLSREFGIKMDTHFKRDYDDYRLFIKANQVKKFYKQFVQDINPEKYDYSNILEDALGKLGISSADFGKVTLRFEGRIISPIAFSRKVDSFEMYVIDRVTLCPTEEQTKMLIKCKNKKYSECRFDSLDVIKDEGVDGSKHKMDCDVPYYVYDTIVHQFSE